jgi:hypothetical protein
MLGSLGRFGQFLAKTFSVFLENQCYGQFYAFTYSNLSNVFRPNILLIITLIPRDNFMKSDLFVVYGTILAIRSQEFIPRLPSKFVSRFWRFLAHNSRMTFGLKTCQQE